MVTLISQTWKYQYITHCHQVSQHIVIATQQATQISTVADQWQWQTINDLRSSDKQHIVTQEPHFTIL